MYVDEVYYHDMFRGEPVDDTDFPALCQRAGEIIEEMTLYRLTEEGFAMMPENTQKLVKNAVCAQIEYLDANGGAEMDMGNGMSGATLGKFSVLWSIFRVRINGTVDIFAKSGENTLANWVDLSGR